MWRLEGEIYKDICLWVVQNPKYGDRDLLAIEVTLHHHKGADKKPKLYVTTPCIPSLRRPRLKIVKQFLTDPRNPAKEV